LADNENNDKLIGDNIFKVFKEYVNQIKGFNEGNEKW